MNEGALDERPFFDGFRLETVRNTRLRLGGEGPPLLMLVHGHPQTHAM